MTTITLNVDGKETTFLPEPERKYAQEGPFTVRVKNYQFRDIFVQVFHHYEDASKFCGVMSCMRVAGILSDRPYCMVIENHAGKDLYSLYI